MDRFEHYGWPFFNEKHLHLAREAETWCIENHSEEQDADSACRKFVKDLGKAGFLKHCVSATPDVRSIALLREVFAYHHGLADFAFVMQGLGSGPIVSPQRAQKHAWLPRVAQGRRLRVRSSEPKPVSDVAALQTAGSPRSGWRIMEQNWISTAALPTLRDLARRRSFRFHRRVKGGDAPSASTASRRTYATLNSAIRMRN